MLLDALVGCNDLGRQVQNTGKHEAEDTDRWKQQIDTLIVVTINTMQAKNQVPHLQLVFFTLGFLDIRIEG